MYIVQLHTPDGTIWLARVDTLEEAKEIARDKADHGDLIPDDDFVSVIKAEAIFTKD